MNRRAFAFVVLGFASLSIVSGHAAAAEKPVKVFILAGQSNMEGKAKLSLLEHQASAPDTAKQFAHLRTDDGKWRVRDDVWIKFLDRHGGLTVGFGSPGCIGPELEFGNAVGDRFDEQVLLIKTAWGGRSLYRDFRPPRSGLPSDEVLEKMLADARKRKPEATLDEIKGQFGASYRAMLEEVNATLADPKKFVPGYAGQGVEIAGFVWFQGWNDMINAEYTAEYDRHMANFIRDVRKEFKSPNLPFVIGQMGVGGVAEDEKNVGMKKFKDAQAKAAALPEFVGNVAVVKTDQYWDMAADAVFKKGWREHIDEWNKVGSDYPYHYLGSAICYSRIGKGFGEAMLRLIEQPAASKE
ncbi:MAG: sialate O-acetylesterase [Planctomycetota bacterium]|nr:MAG: sialate O-acetylesterase [Planctomycetota bacterium]